MRENWPLKWAQIVQNRIPKEDCNLLSQGGRHIENLTSADERFQLDGKFFSSFDLKRDGVIQV